MCPRRPHHHRLRRRCHFRHQFAPVVVPGGLAVIFQHVVPFVDDFEHRGLANPFRVKPP